MSEENPDTTAVPVTNPVKTHVKDPRRVESGRRLARGKSQEEGTTRSY